MAIMIPSDGPRDCTEQSRERWIYNALAKLPNRYYVVHSLALFNIKGSRNAESEADFVVFDTRRGVVCIEAKSGVVAYEDGRWRYANGSVMKHGGPYQQASVNKHNLIDRMDDAGLSTLREKMVFAHAVWFPSIYDSDINGVNLPSEALAGITLTGSDFDNPEEKISRILDLECEIRGRSKKKHGSLSEGEVTQMIDRVLRPAFHIVPSLRTSEAIQTQQFYELYKEQEKVLDFIDDEPFVAIKGAAGSGKTLIAVEQAKRMAQQGKRVLFICYTRALMEELSRSVRDYPRINVFTIYGYAYKTAGSVDFGLLDEKLMRCSPDEFPYEAIIVDEGQDFGCEELCETYIFESFINLMRQKSGSLYVFYDKNQMVLGTDFPEEIDEAETKLCLHVNCRNTKEIAYFCRRAILQESTSEQLGREVSGDLPRIYFPSSYDERLKSIDSEIDCLHRKGVADKDIVIITCGTEKSPGIGPACEYRPGIGGKQQNYYHGFPVFTCRTFKGLEAEAVILISVKRDCWTREVQYNQTQVALPGGLVYAGASRAKRHLGVVCDMSDRECIDVLGRYYNIVSKQKPFKTLAKQLGAEYRTPSMINAFNELDIPF